MLTSRRPLRRVRQALLAAMVLSAVVSALALVLPAFALQLLGTAMPSGSLYTLYVLAAGAVAVLIVAGLVDLGRSLILLRAGLWLDHAAGSGLVEAGLAKGVSGQQLRTMADSLQAVRRALTSRAMTAAMELPWLVAACGGLLLLHPRLAAGCLAVIALSLSACLLVAGRPRGGGLTPDSAREWIEAVAPHAAEIGAMGAAKGVAQRWEFANRPRTAKSWHVGRRGAIAAALARVLLPVGIVAVMALGVQLVVTEALPPALVVAAALLVARAQLSIEPLISGLADIREGRAAWHVLMEAETWLRVDTHRDGADVGDGRIVLDGVSTIHASEQRHGLDNVTLTIERATSVGIVGARGAGKSSIVRAIAGATAPVAGRITLNGRPLHAQQHGMAARSIGYMPDQPGLLPGSVADNICGFEGGSLEAVHAAAVKAGVHALLSSLPQGFETPVGEHGRAVTVGHARAIALARALFGAPRIVVLDEPEAGADDLEVARLATVLQSLRADGVTLVIATNDPRLLRLTDHLVLMNSGSIEAMLPSTQIARLGASSRMPPTAETARAA